MRPKPLPFHVFIHEPCQQNWDAMRDSGAARRHCERCRTDVVDVALLTAPELQKLAERTHGDFCARLTHLPDGTLLLRETPATVIPAMALLRSPLLAGAVLAGSALPLAAQSKAHATAPVLSCAEVTALKQPATPQASLALPAPAPPAPQQKQAVTMGKPAVPVVPLHGSLRLPRGRSIQNALVYAANAAGKSTLFEVEPDGSYAAALPPGKYWLRTEVRADDGELYAAVDGVVLTGPAVTHDLVLQGPVMVTAGAPVLMPSSKPAGR